MGVSTMAEEELVRIVAKVKDSYRAALRSEASARSLDLGDVIMELVDANPRLTSRVKEIEQLRQPGREQKGGGK